MYLDVIYFAVLLSALGVSLVCMVGYAVMYGQVQDKVELLEKKLKYTQELVEFFEDCLIEQELINWAVEEDVKETA